ncbi:MAG TPA: HK97 family phage prohead protease [Agromyces sp.]
MALEFKSFPFELKDYDESKDGRVRFTGYASVFGNEDSYGDVIHPGAFRKTIMEMGTRIKVLWQHDPYTPIGKPEVLREDGVGLYTEAVLSRTRDALDAGILIEDGVVDELSIGFTPMKWAVREGNRAGGRDINELKLYEYSPVTWAANDLAAITGTKDAQVFLRKAHAAAALLRSNPGDERALAAIPDVLEKLHALSVDLEALAANGEPGSAHSLEQRAADSPPIEPVNDNTLALAAELRALANTGR